MAKRPSIAERESYRLSEPSDRRLRKQSRKVRAAIFKDPPPEPDFSLGEAIWTGSPGQRIDLDPMLDGDLGEDTALEQILFAIIDAYPDVSVTTKGKEPKLKSLRQVRLEQALKMLVGAVPPKGKIKNEYEADLERIAWRYFVAAHTTAPSKTALRDIIVSEVVSEDDRARLNHKLVDNLIRGHLREWGRHKDRLLVKVSSRGLPEVEERERDIKQVIRLLGKLGIIPTSKS